jgi:hypothetical protein
MKNKQKLKKKKKNGLRAGVKWYSICLISGRSGVLTPALSNPSEPPKTK